MSRFFSLYKNESFNYIESIKLISSLSKLFSENDTPYLHYRIMENIFCSCFMADNLSRSDTAYDAKIGTLGIGLKTFVCDNNYSMQKIAEFNKESKFLNNIKDKKDIKNLAINISNFRNARIQLANDLYDIKSGEYHIIARKKNKLIFFETNYDKIDISNIKNIKDNKASLAFDDGKNEYSFNYSKSVLQRKFYIPNNYCEINIDILDNPLDILIRLKDNILNNTKTNQKIAGIDFVILPLFSYLKNEKYIPERSGLNQWNANGRKRNLDEVYIPIPAKIHKLCPNFFPNRDIEFILKTPIDENIKVKLCQDNSKALMSNPNSLLSNWLLRKILKLKQGELATIEMLKNLGFDSVIITKETTNIYNIDIMPFGSYEKFIDNVKSYNII